MAMKHDVFADVVISPSPDGCPIFEGGLVNPSAYPRYCRHRRRGKWVNTDIPTADAAIEELVNDDGAPFIFGGVYQYHFGHSVAEFVHRLWVLEKPEYRDCTVLFVAKERQLPAAKYFGELMDYLGVKNWQVITKPTQVKKLVIAEQGKSIKRTSYKDYTAFLKRRYDAQGKGQNDTPQKILLMRGHMQSRRLLGEAHLETYLASEGYHIFRPEEHSLIDQLRTIARASHIIISDGSACHLFDILPKMNAKVAFLGRNKSTTLDLTSLKPKVQKLYSFKDVSSLIVPNGSKGTPKKSRSLLYASLEDIVAFLKEREFIAASAQSIETPPYATDIKDYLETHGAGLGTAEDVADLSIEVLAQNLHAINQLSETIWRKAKRIWQQMLHTVKG